MNKNGNPSPLEVAKCKAVEIMLRRYEGNITHTAEALGLSRPTVRKYIKKCGIKV